MPEGLGDQAMSERQLICRDHVVPPVYASFDGIARGRSRLPRAHDGAAANTAGFLQRVGRPGAVVPRRKQSQPGSASRSRSGADPGRHQSAPCPGRRHCSLAGQTGTEIRRFDGDDAALTGESHAALRQPGLVHLFPRRPRSLTGMGSMLCHDDLHAGRASPAPSPSAWPASDVRVTWSRVTQASASTTREQLRQPGQGSDLDVQPVDKAQLWTYSNGELVHNGLCRTTRPGAATAPR